MFRNNLEITSNFVWTKKWGKDSSLRRVDDAEPRQFTSPIIVLLLVLCFFRPNCDYIPVQCILTRRDHGCALKHRQRIYQESLHVYDRPRGPSSHHQVGALRGLRHSCKFAGKSSVDSRSLGSTASPLSDFVTPICISSPRRCRPPLYPCEPEVISRVCVQLLSRKVAAKRGTNFRQWQSSAGCCGLGKNA